MARNQYIQIIASEQERKLWSRLAQEAGISRAEWIRRAILLQTLTEQLERRNENKSRLNEQEIDS